MHQVFAVSDATGITAERVVQAALTQFEDSAVAITRYGGVRSRERIREIVGEAAEAGGFIVHTLVESSLRYTMLNEGRGRNVATIDLMGPLLARLTDLLAKEPAAKPGTYQPFDAAYLSRIEAIRFAVQHDDGQRTHELHQAEVVLVGPSRTCKTPLSVYLAYRGWRVANVPIILNVEPPEELFALPKKRVVALIVEPDRLALLRQARTKRMGTPHKDYADFDYVRREVANFYRVIERRSDWPLVDMTSRSIEEAAVEVVGLLGRRQKPQ